MPISRETEGQESRRAITQTPRISSAGLQPKGRGGKREFANGVFSRVVAERISEIESSAIESRVTVLIRRILMTQTQVQIESQTKRGTLRNFGMWLSLLLVCCSLAAAQKWNSPATPPQFNVGIALQLTDGRIMIQEAHTFNWWALKPNKFGSYRLGSWQQLKSFPTSWGYSPTYFASAVLRDGRVIIEGGENNNGKEDWTNFGAIYNPVTDTWTKVNPPAGWTHIGDAQSVVLPDGTFMLGNCGYKGDLCPFPQQQ